MIRITDKKNCCGCSACAEICAHECITMTEDNEGFLYPHVDESNCINCGLCEKKCPINNSVLINEFKQQVFLTQHKDNKILKESTSGGAFTAIASWIINQKGIVYGAAYNDDFEIVNLEWKRFKS